MNKIKTLLIANRGEIACRILRTAKRLGIKTVAIYADADQNALHCQLADEAYYVGPVPVEKSYLNMHNVLLAAKQCHADAIHPGYGFLSENPQFAALCEQQGFIFVGPSSDAIAKMAVKDTAKKIMQQANVPTTPGYMGQAQDMLTLTQAANDIGFPIILKAAKGGGGKGMRVVHQARDLTETIASAKRESMNSFGDDTLFIEKYLQQARHIEVQIFRDAAGNAVHLFERDCSLQRRHQKIIEESPAIGIPDEIKQKLFQAAINCAHAIHYVGAGTVEFLYDDNNKQFYFMEMNTRLQVEHPVTEMITGLDLVEWQLRIADGENLPLAQSAIKSEGHAIEARIYAEDPTNHFLPVTGTIKEIILPQKGNYRLDSGIQKNDKISIYFDPLLAKMIVHAANRTEAINALQQALNQYHIVGLTSNLAFLRKILQDSVFRSAKMHTQYVETHLTELLPSTMNLTKESISQACLVYLLHRQQQNQTIGQDSPWEKRNAWRLNLPHEEVLQLQHQQQEFFIHILHLDENKFQIRCAEKGIDTIISGELTPNKLHFSYPSYQGEIDFYIDDEVIILFSEGETSLLRFATRTHSDDEFLEAANHHLLAPMPGIITKIWITAGDNVIAGAKLLALEAMKMEHTLCAPKNGLIKSVHFQVGDQVEERCQLIDFE